MMEKGKMERGVVELVDTESLVPPPVHRGNDRGGIPVGSE